MSRESALEAELQIYKEASALWRRNYVEAAKLADEYETMRKSVITTFKLIRRDINEADNLAAVVDGIDDAVRELENFHGDPA